VCKTGVMAYKTNGADCQASSVPERLGQ